MRIVVTFAVLFGAVLFAVAPSYGQNPALPSGYGAPLPANVHLQHHRSTEFGDAVDALSLLVEAQGRAARNQSEAVVNLQYAERLRLQNLIEREQARLEVEQRRLQLLSLREQRRQVIREIAHANRVPLPEQPVLSQRGHVLWIEPLCGAAFASDRLLLEGQIAELYRAASLDVRSEVLDRINATCQSLLETLAAQQPAMSPNAVAAGTRFVNRLYDELLDPSSVVRGPALTQR